MQNLHWHWEWYFGNIKKENTTDPLDRRLEICNACNVGNEKEFYHRYKHFIIHIVVLLFVKLIP